MQIATIDKSKVWTVEDYLQLDEGLLAQLIDGELIMSPVPNINHQRVLRLLYDHLKEFTTGELFFAPVDLYLGRDTVLQPDLLLVTPHQYHIVTRQGIEGAPGIVAEVTSPSNSFIDRNTKKRKYLEFGVEEYWIVDPGNKTLEIYTADLDKPSFYLSESGEIQSRFLNKGFDLSLIFEF